MTAELHFAIDQLDENQQEEIFSLVKSWLADDYFTLDEAKEILEAEQRIDDGNFVTYNSVEEMFAAFGVEP